MKGGATETRCESETKVKLRQRLGYWKETLQPTFSERVIREIFYEMASVSCVVSEDQLLCSICLEVFKDPVSTSCGHNFCKTCINHHWDHSEKYLCPVCKEDFSLRPQLKTNTCLSEMVSEFRGLQEKAEPEELTDLFEAGHVLCDVCCEPRPRALKSCLVCLASYCPTHLEPHLNTPRLQRHQLICPVENLEERICQEHDRPLELLCQQEQTLICLQCTFSQHKGHTAVPLREESERQQAELNTLIQQRRRKIQEVQDSVKVNKTNADREMEEGVKVFTALMETVKKSLEQFKERIMRDQKKVEDRASDLTEELEQEISVLQQRGAEMKQLSEDHFSFVQTFSTEGNAPALKDWSKVTLSPWSFDGLASEAVSDMEKTLLTQIKKVSEAELRRVQRFELNVTLDPDTANPYLFLSGGNKQVTYRNERRNLSDLPQRYSNGPCVLGKLKISLGRAYFQVQVKEKTTWLLGVARESVERKGKITLTPSRGYWTIGLVNDQYKAFANALITLSLKYHPEVVGVFVDYNKSLVSFYDADTADLLYSFNGCSFSDSVLPFFSPGVNTAVNNSAPLIITPVK